MFKENVKMMRDQRGISLITAIIFVGVALLITLAFLNMDSVSKAWKSGRTADHFNELQTITSNFAMVKDKTKLMYGGQIVDDNPKFSQQFVSPQVSAYLTTSSVVLNGEQGDASNQRKLSIDTAGVPTLTESGVYAAPTKSADGFQLYDSLNVPIKMASGTGKGSKAISDPQPNGQPYLASLTSVDVEDIEKHLFLGLLNGSETQLGRALISDDKTGLAKDTSGGVEDEFGIRAILSLAFGDATTRYASSSVPDSWFTLTPINISALANLSDLDNNRFLDSSKFRLYSISRVASKENAKKVIENNATRFSLNAEQKDALLEVYTAATESIVKDNIIAIPLTDNNVVYSESSDYKYYLFGLHD